MQELRTLLRRATDRKEGSPGGSGPQDVQKLRGVVGVGPIIEGEGDEGSLRLDADDRSEERMQQGAEGSEHTPDRSRGYHWVAPG